ncbi:LAO/AO transport system kinase [Trinickia symbiotica]|uniref:Methylmalonyl Co-A mutase-associated GTPase MeaB n=1 Tax=Trinickia symbiotica TaxID=863227 RepID=A0A2N7WLV5_9BURK|nr:methylmalonyl Co-A mutase-associated GTPase MeaB [Trinickia symbiotica]PMS30439.1 methylmalonyl Co-A mutase-associated GTPase MeaB [Trinickia symbiotica]PPK41227.1 LAO/AO transport system kinase [Trinickia symbiotica]
MSELERISVAQQVDAVLSGNLRAVARLITRAENGDPAIRDVVKQLYRHGGRAQLIGITGPPGAGKSTLLDQLIATYRRHGKRIAVLAVDPSSPYSGGALLGDRVRMNRHDSDPAVFIRSMASRGALGGLAMAAGDALTIMDAMGWDVIVVETVGIGQSEMDVMRYASCIVLLQTALSGDETQLSKAGVLEIGDIFVVNKADVAGSHRMVNALREMVHSRNDQNTLKGWYPDVVATEATTGRGVDELYEKIQRRFDFLSAHPAAAQESSLTQLRARAFEIAKDVIGRRIERELDEHGGDPQLLLDALNRKIDPYDLSDRLFNKASA